METAGVEPAKYKTLTRATFQIAFFHIIKFLTSVLTSIVVFISNTLNSIMSKGGFSQKRWTLFNQNDIFVLQLIGR